MLYLTVPFPWLVSTLCPFFESPPRYRTPELRYLFHHLPLPLRLIFFLLLSSSTSSDAAARSVPRWGGQRFTVGNYHNWDVHSRFAILPILPLTDWIALFYKILIVEKKRRTRHPKARSMLNQWYRWNTNHPGLQILLLREIQQRRMILLCFLFPLERYRLKQAIHCIK